MSAQSHRSDPRILGRRTLEQDHRILAGLLRPGLSVLDVGCGVGAITVGIAKAVAPGGCVLGIDRDESLLAIAREASADIPNLTLVCGDATELDRNQQFDIVTAARTLQWIALPERAVRSMARATKPGGLVVVLDYSHAQNTWEPEPPREFQTFYQAFHAWRAANQWDNEMADHLPVLFQDAGLIDVEIHVQDEIACRGEADFDSRAALWVDVIDNVGERIAAAGFCSSALRQEARTSYAAWVRSDLQRQALALSAVVGRA